MSAAVTNHLFGGSFDLVYTDHDKRDATMTEIQHVRRKALFQQLLEEHAGTPADPMLHSTFLIHCHGLRRDAFGPAPFDPSFVVGDEVKLHVELSRHTPSRIGHVPEVLYHYRDNPDGICHSALYPRLITNIETILAAEMRLRLGRPVRTEKAGRCPVTHVALYRHSTRGWSTRPGAVRRLRDNVRRGPKSHYSAGHSMHAARGQGEERPLAPQGDRLIPSDQQGQASTPTGRNSMGTFINSHQLVKGLDGGERQRPVPTTAVGSCRVRSAVGSCE